MCPNEHAQSNIPENLGKGILYITFKCVKDVSNFSDLCRCVVFTYKVKFLAYDIVTTGGGLHKEALENT